MKFFYNLWAWSITNQSYHSQKLNAVGSRNMRDCTCGCEKGAPIAQLGERQTLDSKIAGSILTRGGVVWSRVRSSPGVVLFGHGFDPHPGRCCLVGCSILTQGGVVSMSRTLHRYCLVLVKPRKPSQND